MDDRGNSFRFKDVLTASRRYILNGRTPLEWFINRYQIITDKHSGIVNDPNGWFNPICDLVLAFKRIVRLSVETAQTQMSTPEAIGGND